ncbi:polysaccharide deacetylase family protein [Haloechinothrix salitolerans]|uniref:Polysaccharide deacetylase family protein n=1 Tax=Haloechinothrix salitolerans TaxID=926830 RepID=A0ABW2C6J3_9PSEU
MSRTSAPSASAPTSSTPSSSAPTTTSATPDPADVGANELGLVPVLMYHQLSPNPVSEYDQTPSEFRAELKRLYREDYRPVTAARFVAGDIDLPAGTHPVVLTFDDSTTSQVQITKDGEPKPGTALAILTEFGEKHPDFNATATFYVNADPFAGDKRALKWLHDHGYEIGAHTSTHANLGALGGAGVRRELVSNINGIKTAAPGAKVRTMALPLGIYPSDRRLARRGSWNGRSYRFDGVMLVGAEPAPSPFAGLDGAGVPRIRSGKGRVKFDSAYWLDWLADHPKRRYTSDGQPDVVSFPRRLAGDLVDDLGAETNPY